MITNIDTKKIRPHDHNPRKDLGDLTELAESIKACGVLQNLTVVRPEAGYCPTCNLYNGALGNCTDGHAGEVRPPCPHYEWDEKYVVVIGHRRLAAAKLAGLKEVPCTVAEMDERQQVATMLLENIQRSDLTVWEQANGFQMMLNFGESVKDISTKTGFSESTVRHRVKLLDLDKEKFKKSEKRGATLHDYMQLEKIKDAELRDKVLDAIGTANFNSELKRAIDQEETKKKQDAARSFLKTFATEIERPDHEVMRYAYGFSLYTNGEYQKPEDAGERKYYFTVSSYGATLYTEKTDQDNIVNAEEEERRQKQAAQRAQLDQIARRFFQLRVEFVKGLTDLKKKSDVICEWAVHSMLLTGYRYGFDSDLFLDLLDLELDENEDFDLAILSGPFERSPEKVLLAAAFSNSGVNRHADYHNWKCEYEENEDLGLLYGYLKKLGYELSDEEKAWRNGSHELYKAREQEHE